MLKVSKLPEYNQGGPNTAQKNGFDQKKMDVTPNSIKPLALVRSPLLRLFTSTLVQYFQSRRTILAIVLALGINGCAGIEIPNLNYQTERERDALAFNSIPPPTYTRGLIPRRTVTPLYPVRARNLRMEGWTLLSFSVGPEGNVLGNTIEVLDADPPEVFDRPSITAARQLSFDNSLEQTVEDVRYVFRYQLEEVDVLRRTERPPDPQFRELIPLRHLTPPYPEYALEQQIEGYAVVEFTVRTDGVVSNVVVTESQPEQVFDNAAIATANRFRFEPRLIFNTPTSVERVSYRFDWKLPRK